MGDGAAVFSDLRDQTEDQSRDRFRVNARMLASRERQNKFRDLATGSGVCYRGSPYPPAHSGRARAIVLLGRLRVRLQTAPNPVEPHQPSSPLGSCGHLIWDLALWSPAH